METGDDCIEKRMGRTAKLGDILNFGRLLLDGDAIPLGDWDVVPKRFGRQVRGG